MKELNLQQGTQEWLEWRRCGVTATEAAAIMDMSEWATPLSTFLAKMKPANSSAPKTAVQEWGSRIEGLLRQKFAENHPEFKVEPGNCFENEWQRASLDGTATTESGERYIVECKTGRSADKWTGEIADVPKGYYAQVQWQMLVSGMRRTYFAVLINGFEYFERVVEFDEAFAAKMYQVCQTFWLNYLNGIKPPVSKVHPEIDQPLLSSLAGEQTDKEAPLEVEPALYEQYNTARAEFEAATIRYGAIKAELTELLAKHEYLLHDGKKFASIVKMKPRESVDTAKLKRDYPEVYEAVKKLGAGTCYPKFG